MRHWTHKYMTIEYKKMNCSKFVEHILRDHYGRDYSFPQSEGSLFNQSLQIKTSVPSFASRTDNPQDGDLILMHGKRMLCHVGLYLKIGREEYVFHTESSKKTALLHRLRELTSYGYSVEGIYSWLK